MESVLRLRRYGAAAAYSGEEAMRRVGCLFSALKRQLEPSQRQELAAVLPEEVDAWFLNA